MVKTVWLSYQQAFHKENMKNKVAFVDWYLPFYMVLYVNIINKDWMRSVRLSEMICMLLLVFLMVVSTLCDNQLPDLFYYVPVTKEMRREYIKYGFWIKIAVAFASACIVYLIPLLIGQVTIIEWLLLVAITVIGFVPLATQNHVKDKGFMAWAKIVFVMIPFFYLSYVADARNGMPWKWGKVVLIALSVVIYSVNLFWSRGRIRTQMKEELI